MVVTGKQLRFQLEPPPLFGTRLARTADPDTSHEAARECIASGRLGRHMRLALSAIVKHQGCTSAELVEWCELNRHEVARRLPDLEKRGLVRQGESRACWVTKRQSVTWWPTLMGLEAVAG